ncbi:MAG: GNAT family N-acetyltransferase [Bacteroidota bacterium]
MNLRVVHVKDRAELKLAFAIREQVYIVEQQIDRAEEFDEFDNGSEHFLAYLDNKPAGTCRYRTTDAGIKLERFATIEGFRGRGVASALMETMTKYIELSFSEQKKLYLNAQVSAMPLYAKFGFQSEGPIFLECNIAHQKMVRLLR